MRRFVGRSQRARQKCAHGFTQSSWSGRKRVQSLMWSESTGWKRSRKVERAPWARLGARVAAKNRKKPQSQSIPLSQKAPSLEFGSFGHARENLISWGKRYSQEKHKERLSLGWRTPSAIQKWEKTAWKTSRNTWRGKRDEMAKIYTNQKTQFENGETFRRLSRDSEVNLLIETILFVEKCIVLFVNFRLKIWYTRFALELSRIEF